MIDPDRLCPGCMETDSGVGKCPVCGFDRQEYERERPLRILPSMTLLHGRYLLGRTLGIGGFGITYLAMDLAQERKVAIKEYFPNGLAERTVMADGDYRIRISGSQQKRYYDKGLASFIREANTMQTLRRTEGIVQVLGFFQENNTAYLVMEYLPGMSLRAYVKISGLPLKEEDVLEMIWPVINSLAIIHRKGIIHRDISPDNIIYGPDKSVTLIDFGAARQATGDSNKSLTIMLKRGYAPMEQYYTTGKQGAWTDIYAICATLYYLLSGTIPPDSIDRLAADELKPLLTLNFRISRHVSDAVGKGLAVKAQDRYQTMEALIEDLYEGMFVVEERKEDPGQIPSQTADGQERKREQNTAAGQGGGTEESTVAESGSQMPGWVKGAAVIILAIVVILVAIFLWNRLPFILVRQVGSIKEVFF